MDTSLSRRKFLKTTAIAGVAAGLSPAVSPLQAQAKALPPIKLGLASYTFRNFDRAQVIAFMKQLRLTDLNAKDVHDHLPIDPAEEARAVADYTAAGIKLHAAGTVNLAKDEDGDIHDKFAYCKRAGIDVMVAGDPTPQNLPRIEKFVKQYDMRIAIHNHGPEDKLWHSPLDVLAAVRQMDARIGCCIDVGHASRAGVDVPKTIREVGPRVFDIHMKDLTSFSDKESQVAVGEGIMPVREIFEALLAIRYTGFVDLEYEVHPDDPIPGVSNSFSYMRGVLAGMA